MAECSRKLKALARSIKCPVIVSSQLNRQAEDQTTPPDLRHLRESGAIEQDADMVLMIHRPERHHILVDEKTNCSTKGMGILSVAKHRNGSTGRIYYSYNPSMSHITAFKPSTFSEEEIANHNELAEQAKNSRNAKPETQYCVLINSGPKSKKKTKKDKNQEKPRNDYNGQQDLFKDN